MRTKCREDGRQQGLGSSINPVARLRVLLYAGISLAVTNLYGATRCAEGGSHASVAMINDTIEAPSWAVPYGAEFWRSGVSDSGQSPVDVYKAIDRVTHALRSDEHAAFRVNSRNYQLRTDGFCTWLGRNRRADGRIRTSSILWGGKQLYSSANGPESRLVWGNTVQTLLNGEIGLVEHLEATGAGVEISWVLGTRPNRTGDLNIEWEFSDAEKARVDNAAASRPANHDFRIGDAILVDQTGRRVKLNTITSGGRMRIAASSDLLEQAVFPIAIDPSITPAFEINEPVESMADGDQVIESLSWGVTNWLVVWSDTRLGGMTEYPFAARVSEEGEVLDPYGVFIGRYLPGGQPSVSFGTSDWLVVAGSPLRGVRIAQSGFIRDQVPIDIASIESDYPTWSAVSWGDTNWFVVYWDLGIRGVRVSEEGAVLDPSPRILSDQGTYPGFPVVEWGSDRWMALWGERHGDHLGIYGTEIHPDGTVGIPIGVLTNSWFDYRPAVSWGVSNWLVCGYRTDLDEVRGVRVQPGSAIREEQSFRVCTGSIPSVAWGSTNWLVLAHDYHSDKTVPDIHAVRVTPEGTVLDNVPQALGSRLRNAGVGQVARGSNDWLVVFSSTVSYDDNLYGIRISDDLGVLDDPEFPIGLSAQTQMKPALTWGGTNWLMVWEDLRESGEIYTIRAARVTPYGEPLDPYGIPICISSNHAQQPSVGWGETNWLVAWRWAGRINGLRVAPDGSSPDPEDGFPIGFATDTPNMSRYVPQVVWGGTNWFVAWQAYWYSSMCSRCPSYHEIRGSRVAPSGTVLDPDEIRVRSTSPSYFEFLVRGTTNWFVVWRDSATDYFYGLRLGEDGSLVHTQSLVLAEYDVTSPQLSMSWNGSNWLMAWTGSDGIYAARINEREGVLDDPLVPLVSSWGSAGNPTVTAQGSDWLVVWEDGTNGPYNILGLRIDAEGIPKDSGPLVITTNRLVPSGLYGLAGPSAAYGPEGQACVAYESYRPAPYESIKLEARFLYDDASYIDARAGLNGRLSPHGYVMVSNGADVAFTIQAADYYHISEMMTNGLPVVGAEGNIIHTSTWFNVSTSGALCVSFAPNLSLFNTPEWWLAQNGCTNDFANAALADGDEDGVPAWAEYRADTDPVSPDSALLVRQVVLDGESATVEWQGGVLATQYIESKSDLMDPEEEWQVIYTNHPPTAITNVMLNSGVTNETRYYRIRAER